MAKPDSLSLAFIDKRPVAAGRVLASMDAKDAAAFLDEAPPNRVARALAHMGAWSAASILVHTKAKLSAAALRALPYSDAAAILRLMTPATRAMALEALPEKLQRDFTLSLSYPDDSVGAHMSTSIMTQRPFHTVADARAEVRRAQDADVAVVFVVDDDHQMTGVVAPDTLLRQPGKATLQDVMDTDIEALSARARIAIVADAPGWDAYTHLPVLSRGKAVIGALSRKSTAQFRKDTESPTLLGHTGLVASMMSALAATISGLAMLGRRRESEKPDSKTATGNHHEHTGPKSR